MRPVPAFLILCSFGVLMVGCGKQQADKAVQKEATSKDSSVAKNETQKAMPPADSARRSSKAQPPVEGQGNPSLGVEPPEIYRPQNRAKSTKSGKEESGKGVAHSDGAPPMPPKNSLPVETLPPAAEPEDLLAKAKTNEEFQRVKVFYGTNRKPLDEMAPDPFGLQISWLLRAGLVAAGVTILSFVFLVRSKPLRFLFGLTLCAFLMLGGMYGFHWLGSMKQSVYGNEAGSLAFGTCEVSIPKDHRMGQIESPSIFRGEFKEVPEKHVMILSVIKKSDDLFYTELSDTVRRSASKVKRAFVFVHGFNVSFEEAAKRTAQMAYDLEFDGAPIFYSWPAHGGEFRYRADEEAVIETVQSLHEFLEGVAEKSGADQIHLIAHSMGNRALTSALRAIAIDSKWSGKQMFQEVLLAAPDIGEKDFRETIYPAIRTTAHQMTLYASANDRALLISRNINKERRVGDAQGGICCLPNLDSVDVSAVDTSFVGHSYYGENSSVITDIRAVLRRESARLKWEWLKQTYAEELPFWVFRAMPTPAEKLAKRPVEIVR